MGVEAYSGTCKPHEVGITCDARKCYADENLPLGARFERYEDTLYAFCPEHMARVKAYQPVELTDTVGRTGNFSADAERQDRFASHQVGKEQALYMNEIRHDCLRLAERVAKLVPPGREQATALTNLEQVMFWSNAGIARNGPPR